MDWAALEGRLRPFVRKRVRSDADADDVLQEVFLRVQRGLASLRDEERFGPWLWRIVRNGIADHHRGRAPAAMPDPDAIVAAEDDGAAARELASCIAPFVGELPSPYREAVTMVDLEGLTHGEAAARAGVTEPGMKSRVQRGRAKLRGLVEACCRVELDSRQRVTGYERRGGGSCGGCP
jgi:RNA polymerase sigma-70 factor (ECF subfamily)